MELLNKPICQFVIDISSLIDANKASFLSKTNPPSMITLPVLIINGGLVSPPAETAPTKVTYSVLGLLCVNSFFDLVTIH
jgi:hypothetical protein